jgi:hypothetical protein
MSRSWKKCPGSSDGDRSKKWVKRAANRKVRKCRYVSGKSAHWKRLYPQWDICDYNYREYSWKEMLQTAKERYQHDWNYDDLVENNKAIWQFFWHYVRK